MAGRSARAGLRHGPLRPRHVRHLRVLPAARGIAAGAFGVCGNAYAPADGAVVAVGFGCGAHSDVRVEATSPVAVAELVYDDGVDLEPAE